MQENIEEWSYPVGRFAAPDTYDAMQLKQWTDVLEAGPSWYDAVIENLDEAQLQTAYRPGGWTVNQVIHHVADSHINAYVRCRLALTEHQPVINPYNEKLWAELPDNDTVPVNVSITLLHALHRRWVALLRTCSDEQWTRSYYHPEQETYMPLWKMTAMYAWHTRHHFAQLRSLRQRQGWW